MNALVRLVVGLALLLTVPVCASAGEDADDGHRTTTITYLSGDSVYVGAGEGDGLRPGDRLTAVGLVLEVVETSSTRAVCRLVEGDPAGLAVGVEVAWVASGSTGLDTEIPPRTVARSSGRRRPSGVHGRIGVRYLATRDGINERGDVSSPALDLRLDSRGLYGSPWGVEVDVRARRITTTDADGADVDDDASRVYRARVDWDRPGPGWRFAAGRQVAPELANVSLFDGASVAWDGVRTGAGGFVGTQPDGADWGFSSETREAGGWFGVRSVAGAATRWGVNLGAVASRQDGEIDREFLFVQGRVSTRRVHLYATQEVDVNRDWKTDEAGESSLEPTSSFVTVRVRATDAVGLVAGFDNRRNVRLYRDRVTPATEFDDSFRRGAWAGIDARAGRHLRLGVSGRSSSGGSAGTATAWTAHAGLVRLTDLDLGVRVRATTWDDDRLEGTLIVVALSIDPTPLFGVTVQGGVRDEASKLNAALDDTVSWFGVDLDLDLGAGFYATVSAERSNGDFEEVDRAYATIAWRF